MPHPGALHHATTIMILPSRTSLSPSHLQTTESKLIMRPTNPHHHGHEPHMDGNQLYGRGGTLIECSPCPLRALHGEHRPPRHYHAEANSLLSSTVV